MKVGAAKADITPPLGMELEGYGARASGASGVDTLVASADAPDGDSETALEFAEATCFAPAKARLVQGATAMISLLLGDRSIEVSARARYRFWRRPRPLALALE